MRKARGFHLLGTGVVVASGLALNCGRVAEQTHLEVSSPEVHEAHGAPGVSGDCPKDLPVPKEWITELDAPYVGSFAGDVAMATDPCGNIALAWDQGDGFGTTGDPIPTAARIYSDGKVDWQRRMGDEKGDLGFTGEPLTVNDIKTDEFGNIYLLTNSWMQVFTPSGEAYPGIEEPLAHIRGLFMQQIAAGWAVIGPGYAEFRLPSGKLAWSSNGVGDENWNQSRQDDFILLDEVERKYLMTLESAASQRPQGPYERWVLEQVPLHAGKKPNYRSGQPDPLLEESSEELFTVAGKLARLGDQVLYAYGEVDPETWACKTAVLRIVSDPSWQADVPICGHPTQLLVSPSGHILSLWVVPVGPVRGDLYYGIPTLVQLEANGQHMRTWDLSGALGLVDRSPLSLRRNVVMSLTLDPDYVILAAASREHEQVRVMQLSLDDD